MRQMKPKVKHPSPNDPSGVGRMFREPGKQNAHIARAKARAKEHERKALAMAAKDKDADKMFSVAEVDEMTPPHFKDGAKGVDKMRFGVTVDEQPIPTVDAAGKAAIETVREEEKEQAKLLYDRSTWKQV